MPELGVAAAIDACPDSSFAWSDHRWLAKGPTVLVRPAI